MVVNRDFADLLKRNGWDTFEAVWAKSADAAVAKNLRTDRVTLRFTLSDGKQSRVFYIKRHQRSSWKEYIKPLLRLTWPILGARNEWNALLDFHQAGLPTMIPVAIGELGENSFLITEGLEDCTKLSELKSDHTQSFAGRVKLIKQIAWLAKTMHGAGMHHQDFYLGHILRSNSNPDQLFVIDLGRVQKHARLAHRWIVKDLAQLDYSAKASKREQARFLREYLGRPLEKRDRALMRQIQSKTNRIGRHSKKNKL